MQGFYVTQLDKDFNNNKKKDANIAIEPLSYIVLTNSYFLGALGASISLKN